MKFHENEKADVEKIRNIALSIYIVELYSHAYRAIE